MIRAWAFAAGLTCGFAAYGPPAGAAGLSLDRQVQGHLGVVTQKLAATHRASEIDAFAKVLDPGPLAQLVSDLQTAQAAAVASKAEAERSAALNKADGGVSAKDVETAVAQARSDALKVQALRARLGLEWGPGIARMSDAQRDRLVKALADGTAALVHVDTHHNAGQAGARSVRIDVGADSVGGAVIGPARVAESRLQSSGLIVEVSGKAAIQLSVGLTQSAHIVSASPQTGFILPRAALIRFRGSDWAYVRAGPTRFERRLVLNPLPQDNGFFVTGGFSPGEEVVVQGAAALFASEQTDPAQAR